MAAGCGKLHDGVGKKSNWQKNGESVRDRGAEP